MGLSIKFGVRRIVVAAVLAINALAAPVAAQTEVNMSTPLVVNNDRGGLLLSRITELAELRQQSRPVEIRGNVCYSTCTMYLGLETTCVSRSTVFGFHGPSTFGFPLEPATFDRASEIIASHYPAELQEWYMETGRHELLRVYRLRGEVLIRLGVQEC